MKAQLWSLDFAASITVFLLALGVALFAWNYTSSQAGEQSLFNTLENTALTVSDSLIRTRGIPEAWTSDNVQFAGLAIDENYLSKQKVSEFLELSYGKSKTAMGLGRLEYHFNLSYANHTVIEVDGVQAIAGVQPNSSAFIVVPVERLVLYEGIPSRMKLRVWLQS